MQYCLLAAGLAAGLAVATHTCVKMTATPISDPAREAFSRFPVSITRTGQETLIAGLPPHVMDAIGRE
eukprot:7343797-Lingulodinium_polyedra.AAC.1